MSLFEWYSNRIQSYLLSDLFLPGMILNNGGTEASPRGSQKSQSMLVIQKKNPLSIYEISNCPLLPINALKNASKSTVVAPKGT